MASIAVMQADVYSLMARLIESGIPNIEVSDFHLALFGDGFLFDPEHTTWADIKAEEITGVGYTSGGKEVIYGVDITTYNAATGIWAWGPACPALEWDGADFTLDPVRWGVLYEYTDDIYNEGFPDDASVLVCAYRLTSLAEPDDEKFRWNFHADGLVKWTAKFTVAPV